MIVKRCLRKRGELKGFVKMSAIWFSVSTCFTVMVPFCICARKWWYLMLICFVLGRIFGTFDNSRAPMLFSNALQCTAVCAFVIIGIFLFLVLNKVISPVRLPLSATLASPWTITSFCLFQLTALDLMYGMISLILYPSKYTLITPVDTTMKKIH